MGMWQSVVLMEPAKAVFAQIVQFFVNVLLVICILLIGWLISNFIIKPVVTRLLRTVKLDELSDRIELDSLLAKGGIKYSLSELIGVICYWLSILITVVVAVNSIGLTVAAELLQKIVLFVPSIIAAIFIIILGMFVATLLRNIVRTAATNAGLSQVNLLSKLVEILVLVFAIITALKQLAIDVRIIEFAISIALAAAGLAVALAFGLGCKEMAGKFLNEFIDKIKK
jgi:small-conductance mechanosensitive channel